LILSIFTRYYRVVVLTVSRGWETEPFCLPESHYIRPSAIVLSRVKKILRIFVCHQWMHTVCI